MADGRGAARVTDTVTHGSEAGAAVSAPPTTRRRRRRGAAHTAQHAARQRPRSLRERIESTDPEVLKRRAAFLQAIRVFEGTAGENGARTMYGGKLAPDDKDHPRELAAARFKMKGKWYWTHAAGAYQFQPGTWDTYKEALELPDFSLESQNKAALADIADKKGGALLEAIDRGDVEEAGYGLRREWTSLPGGPQQRGTGADLREAYELALRGTPAQSLGDLPSRRLPRLEKAADKAEKAAKRAEANAQAAADAAAQRPSPARTRAAERAKQKAKTARAKATAAHKAVEDAKAGASAPAPAPTPAQRRSQPPPPARPAPPTPGAVTRAATAGASTGKVGTGGSGEVKEGSPNVNVEGHPAARAGVDHAKCDRHPPKLISEGSDSVFVNGKPFARLSDLTQCGAATASSSSSVIVGGGTTTVADVRGTGAAGRAPPLLGVLPVGGTLRAAAAGRVFAGRGDGWTLYAEVEAAASGLPMGSRPR